MAKIGRDERERLAHAIHAHDYLRDVLAAIEHLHHVVFHNDDTADWSRVRPSAEQILTAEILTRHHGDFARVFHRLRAMEADGKPWRAAVRDLAATIHSYFTTPLGLLIRKDLFGDEAVYLSARAAEFLTRQRIPELAWSAGTS